MWKYRVNQHLIVLNLYSVSINKILVTKDNTVKVSQNLNLMWNVSTPWNQQLSMYAFGTKHWKANELQKPSSTKQMSKVQNIWTEIWKYKYNQVNLVLAIFTSACLH